jgi:hypothetical protein
VLFASSEGEASFFFVIERYFAKQIAIGPRPLHETIKNELKTEVPWKPKHPARIANDVALDWGILPFPFSSSNAGT